jgi:tryptophanyl-tRNA synthetase
MSLRDGSKKMSKSDSSSMTRIELKDDNDLIVKKISKAKTDPLPMPGSLEELDSRPEVRNLLNIFSSLKEETVSETINEFNGKQFSDFKKNLSDLLISKLEPIRLELLKIEADKSYIRDVLSNGSYKAIEKSEKTIKEIKNIIGLG